jgi:hypothetical protein
LTINGEPNILLKKANETVYRKLPEIAKNSLKKLPLRLRTRDADNIYEWLKIDFSQSACNELRDIEGSISVINSTYSKPITGRICQRSFAIGYPSFTEKKFEISIPESLINLLPSWLCLDVYLNLTKSACLNISPDRTEVVEDEKFKKLRDLIEKEAILKVGEYFKRASEILDINKLIDLHEYLFSGDYFNFDYNSEDVPLSDTGKDFLSNCILFRCLEPNGTKNFLTIDKIQAYENIGVVSDEWGKIGIDPTTVKFIKKHNILLVIFSDSNGWTTDINNAFYKIMVEQYYNNMFRSRILVQDLLPAFFFHLIRSNSLDLTNVPNHFICLDSSIRKIVLIFENGGLNISIDINHPMFSSLPMGVANIKYSRVFGSLENEISEVFTESLKMTTEDEPAVEFQCASFRRTLVR